MNIFRTSDRARRKRLAQLTQGWIDQGILDDPTQGCQAPPELCIDPFCPTHGYVGQVIILDVVAEPDVAGTDARTDDPSDAVRAEVANIISQIDDAS